MAKAEPLVITVSNKTMLDLEQAIEDAHAGAYPSIPAQLDRRVKVLRLPSNLVLDWFTMAVRGFPQCVALPTLTGLPLDVKILSVQTDWRCRTIDFLLAHESFDLVAEGDVPPDIGANALGMEYEVIELPDRTPHVPVCHACEGRGFWDVPTDEGKTIAISCSVCGGN